MGLSGCIVARRALRFLPHEELTLPIDLRQDCDGRKCSPTETCVHGKCVSATIPDPALCRGAGCPDSILLTGSIPDAGDDGPDVSEGGSSGRCDGGTCPPTSSCERLPTTCGSPATDDCCNSPVVMGGTFMRETGPLTTVSTFRLDKYEVTIGRFRAFVNAVIDGYVPAAGSGKHVHLAAGGLVNLYDNMNLEKGWDSSWNAYLPTMPVDWGDTNHLSCDTTLWPSSPGSNEQKPVSCVNWFQAYAFCIWDGGFLPTFNETNFATLGGEERRAHPWGPDPVAPERATYCTATDCTQAVPNDVGSKPLGDGRYLQSDLVGGVWEWVLDQSNNLDSCRDCMFYKPGLVIGTNVGGGYKSPSTDLEMGHIGTLEVDKRHGDLGFRCARPP
jgi:formylglycine-generating enzyme required for sulfatase activity